MEPLSIVGIMILIIVALFLGKILSILGRIVFVALIIALVLVFAFGISLNQVVDWGLQVILLAF